MNETVSKVLQVVLNLVENYVAETPSQTDDMIVSLLKSLLSGVITQSEGVAAADFEAAVESLPEPVQAQVESAIQELKGI